MRAYYFMVVLIIATLACKEEVQLDSQNNKNLLVVEGLITNLPGPYIIKLSLSSSIEKPMIIPYSGCTITLIDNLGNSELLTEKTPGNYYTAESGMQGTIGNGYSISIVTPDGKTLKTDFQVLKDTIGIDSAYAEYVEKELLGYVYDVPALQFFINTKISSVPDNYFLWTMTETYEYDIDHPILYYENKWGDKIFYDTTYNVFKTCWAVENVKYIYTGKTNNLNNPQIIHQPLHIVTTETKKLTKKYGVLIYQYVIDEQAYNYWQYIEKQSADNDYLFSSQPYAIKGNVKNIDNQDEMVLGYFTVASISQKKLFVNALNGPFYYSTCVVITDKAAIAEYIKNHEAPFFFVENDQGMVGLTYPDCIDCRKAGGYLEKPDLWIY